MRDTYLQHQRDRLSRLGYPPELLTDAEISQHCRPANEHRTTRPKFDERRNNDRLEHPICRLSESVMSEAIQELSDLDIRRFWVRAVGEGRHDDANIIERVLSRRNSGSGVRDDEN